MANSGRSPPTGPRSSHTLRPGVDSYRPNYPPPARNPLPSFLPPPPPADHGRPFAMETGMQQKRKASRSPEGVTTARKASRPTLAGAKDLEGSLTPNLRHESRQSSVSERAPNSAVEGHLPRLINGRHVQSPMSPGSNGTPYEDATSTRSTPQPGHPARKAITVPTNQSLAGTQPPTSILQIIEGMNDRFARHASLTVQRQISYDAYKSAKEELERAQKLGPNYSALADGIIQSKNSYRAKAEKFEARANDEKVTLRALATSLADVVKDATSDQGAVSRDEHETLLKAHDKLQQDHNNFQDQMTRQFALLRQEMQSNQEKHCSDLQDLQIQMESKIKQETPALEKRVSIIETTTGALSKLDSKYKDEIPPLKTRVLQLENAHESLQPDVDKAFRVQAKIIEDVRQQDNIMQERLKKLESTLDPRGPSPTPQKMSGEVSAALAGLRQELDDVYSNINGTHDEDYDAVVDRASSFRKRLHHVEQDIANLKEETHEQGKKTVVQRVKNHDQMINNISSELERVKDTSNIGSSLKPRLDRIEVDVKRLSRDPGTVPVAIMPATKGQSPASENAEYFANLEARLNEMDETLGKAVMEDDQDKRDEAITRMVKDVNATASEQVSQLGRRLSSLNAEIETCCKVQQQLSDDFVEIQRSGTGESQHVTSLSQRVERQGQDWREAVAKLEKARTVADDGVEHMKINIEILNGGLNALRDELATVANTAPAAQIGGLKQFKPLTRESPAVQSPWGSNVNSPQLNGHGSPMPHPGASAAKSLDRDMAILRDQCNGLSGFVHQLKQRFDNLTTDELARNMVSQMSELYPAARDFQKAVDGLKLRDQNLEQRVSGLQSTATQAASTLSNVRKDLFALREDVDQADRTAKAAEHRVRHESSTDDFTQSPDWRELQAGVNTLREDQIGLSQRVQNIGTADTETLQTMRDCINNAQNDVSKINRRVDDSIKFQKSAENDWSGKADDLDNEIRSLRASISKVETQSAIAVSAAKDQTPSTYASRTRDIAREATNRVRALEGELKDLQNNIHKVETRVKDSDVAAKDRGPDYFATQTRTIAEQARDLATALNQDKESLVETFKIQQAFNQSVEKQHTTYRKRLDSHETRLDKHSSDLQGLEQLDLSTRLTQVDVHRTQLAKLRAQSDAMEDHLKKKGHIRSGAN